MNIVEKIINLLGLEKTPSPPAEVNRLHQLLDQARHLRRVEAYTEALELLDQALALVQNERPNDKITRAVINLQRVNVLIYQGDWTAAKATLDDVRRDAHESDDKTQMAYTLNGAGALAQARGDWPAARRCYEEALKLAREAKSAGGEGRALGHLGVTYLHENNTGYAARLLRESVTKLNTTDDIEMGSYFVGRLGQALIETGQQAEGQQLLTRALRMAQRLDHRTYQRLWSVALAEIERANSNHQLAHRYYGEALPLFETAYHARGHLVALARMSRLCLDLDLNAEAVDYARKAINVRAELLAGDSWTGGDGRDDAALDALTTGTLGMALRAAGSHEEALHHLEAAANAYQPAGGLLPDETLLAVLRHLALARGEHDDDPAALTAYRRAVQQAEALDLPQEIARAHRDLGLLYMKQGRRADAIRAWSDALAIYEVEKAPTQIARLYIDIANARRYLGQGQRAIRDYEQALMAVNALRDEDLSTRGVVLANAATAYADRGDVDSAESFFRESLAIAEQTGNRAAEATRRGNYGWFLLAIGRPRQAQNTLKRALELSRALNLTLQSAVQADNLGLVHRALGEYSTALDYHRQALARLDGERDPHWEAMIKTNQAETRMLAGEVEPAQTLLDEALATAHANSDIEATIRALTGMARLRVRQAQPEAADALLTEAVNLARKADMRRLLAEALRVYSEQQAALNRREHSLQLWEEALRLFQTLRAPQSKLEPAWLIDGARDEN